MKIITPVGVTRATIYSMRERGVSHEVYLIAYDDMNGDRHMHTVNPMSITSIDEGVHRCIVDEQVFQWSIDVEAAGWRHEW